MNDALDKITFEQKRTFAALFCEGMSKKDAVKKAGIVISDKDLAFLLNDPEVAALCGEIGKGMALENFVRAQRSLRDLDMREPNSTNRKLLDMYSRLGVNATAVLAAINSPGARRRLTDAAITNALRGGSDEPKPLCRGTHQNPPQRLSHDDKIIDVGSKAVN